MRKTSLAVAGLILSGFALSGATCSDTLSPTVTAAYAAAYADVCPAYGAGTFNGYQSAPSGSPQNAAYLAMGSLCTAGVPTTAVAAGMDLLQVLAIVIPTLVATKGFHFHTATVALVERAARVSHVKIAAKDLLALEQNAR